MATSFYRVFKWFHSSLLGYDKYLVMSQVIPINSG